MYRYPDHIHDRDEWISGWMENKFVLWGWEAIREGIVKSFKDGRVRHMVARVEIRRGRPCVEMGCGIELLPVYNWVCDKPVSRLPVVILSLDQAQYFRTCQKCMASHA